MGMRRILQFRLRSSLDAFRPMASMSPPPCFFRRWAPRRLSKTVFQGPKRIELVSSNQSVPMLSQLAVALAAGGLSPSQRYLQLQATNFDFIPLHEMIKVARLGCSRLESFSRTDNPSCLIRDQETGFQIRPSWSA